MFGHPPPPGVVEVGAALGECRRQDPFFVSTVARWEVDAAHYGGGGARFAPASGRHIYGEEFMWCKEFPTLQLVFFLLLYINDGLFYIWYFISSVLIVLELLFCVGDYSSLEDVWVLVVRL